jgi:spermidine synthase
MYLYPELPYWYVWLFDFLNASQHPEAAWWVSLVMAGLVMAPAAVLMGMHFPIAVRALVTDAGQLGAGVGVLYGANTLGGVFGAFVAGFVLLPVVWMQGTILVAALAGLMAAALLMIRAAEGSRRAWLPVGSVGLVALTLGLAFVAQRPPWNPLLMTAGLYHYVTTFDDHSRAGIRQYSTGLYDLRFYEEGLTSVVTVAQNKGSAHLWLAVNGKVDASTTSDMPTQVLLAALPMQFVEAPADVLIVGLASGVSAGAAARSSHVKRLDIAEIEPAVERGAAYFSAWNHNVLADPRVEVIHNDARNHLLLTEPGRYDIVISEPSNPWISGVANLFTREFFELGKTRLKPGGVWSQWIQTYGMDSVDLRSLLRTFADVYPHVLVYTTTDQSDLVVVGSESVLDMTQERTRRAIDVHGLAPDLVRVGISSNIEMVSLFVMDRPAIMAMTEGVTPNTDDNMRIEYSTPLKLHREMRGENLQMLMAHAGLPDAALGSSADLWQTLAEVYQRRRDIRYQAAINRAAALETRSGQTMMPLPD